MQIIILRAEPGAHRTAEAVEKLGFTPVCAPLLKVERTASLSALDLSGIQAVAFTSAAGIDAAVQDAERERLKEALFCLPAYCVGGASARRASLAGFGTVLSADGDAEDLSKMLSALDPTKGDVLHLHGLDVARPLRSQDGPPIRTKALYRADRTDRLSADAVRALSAPQAGVLIHSRRIAESFVAATSEQTQLRATLFAISARAAEPLAQLGSHSIRTASAPNEGAMLADVVEWAERSLSDE